VKHFIAINDFATVKAFNALQQLRQRDRPLIIVSAVVSRTPPSAPHRQRGRIPLFERVMGGPMG
jgi:hypothetical protein